MLDINLRKLLDSQQVVDEAGKEHTLESNISHSEIEFLENLIEKNNITRSLEIGCAMGISSLAICSSLQRKNKPFHHTIIDPYQSTNWKNIGKTTLENNSIRDFNLIEKGSEIALPELLSKQERFDFIFIDGWHTMDHTILDMFYSLKLLNIGGLLVIDDVVMQPVNKAVRYFLNFPSVRLLAGNPQHEVSFKRSLFYTIADIFSLLTYIVPFRKHIFNHEIITSDRKLKIGTSMIALKKVSEDNRTWDWYKHF